jgi:long-chain acyl-CoA synthetase
MSGDIIAALAGAAERRPQAAAFVQNGDVLTYERLMRRTAGAREVLADLPDRVGILATSGIDWAVADLALWASDRSVVPLPTFFTDAQLGHLVRDAGIERVLVDDVNAGRAGKLGLPALPLPRRESGASGSWRMTGRRISYTSGSTGAPKGVVLQASQIAHTCHGLVQTIEATADDVQLSLLPFEILLEAICGIYLPVLVGGTAHVATGIAAADPRELGKRMCEEIDSARPTTMVLVPQLLRAWTLMLEANGTRAPSCLRFVAVGGAPVPSWLAEKAWAAGIPVHEGYGLTECGSVVAVNAPGRRRGGTVGRPLPGVSVSIADDGEIVVESASVMSGYLGDESTGSRRSWRTGDVGELDADGYLRVVGRLGDRMVTPNGRNISPTWIEDLLSADPVTAYSVVFPAADGSVAAYIEPFPSGAEGDLKPTPEEIGDAIRMLCRDAPRYAVPRRVVVGVPGELRRRSLLTANGRPRRREIADTFSATDTSWTWIGEKPDVVL